MKFAFKADKKATASIRQSFPSAKSRKGVCEVKIESEGPADAIDETRKLLEKIRSVAQNPESL